MRNKALIPAVLVSAVALFVATSSAFGFDEDAAKALTKKSGCMKCHSVTAKKDGPSFKHIAEELKGKADAEKKLYVHLTTKPTIKIDGQEEKHSSLKTTDDAEIKNVIQWILAQ